MERTFTIIKPNAVAAGNTGKMLDMICSAGFRICALKMTFLSRNDAEKFYSIHKGKYFFNRLIEFMTAGPIVVAILERENAIEDFRKLVGNTDPAQAEQGTIRHYFAQSMTRNAIHASDSEQNAELEWAQFFCESEISVAEYHADNDRIDGLKE